MTNLIVTCRNLAKRLLHVNTVDTSCGKMTVSTTCHTKTVLWRNDGAWLVITPPPSVLTKLWDLSRCDPMTSQDVWKLELVILISKHLPF